MVTNNVSSFCTTLVRMSDAVSTCIAFCCRWRLRCDPNGKRPRVLCFALNEQVVFLHRRHPGVYKLGNRALDALWGGDEFGAKQKASAEERLRGKDEDDGQ